MSTTEVLHPPAKLSSFGNTFDMLYSLSPERVTSMLGRRVESFFDLRESQPGNLKKFIQIGRQGKRILVFAENHQSYIDPIAFLPAIRKIKSDLKLKGSRMVIARSLEQGQQGETSKFFQVADPYLEQNSVETVTVIRPQDVEQYGMKKGRENVDAFDKMVASYPDEKLLIILPPGETREGKIAEDGLHRNGYREFTSEHAALARVLSKTLLSGAGFAVLPGAINESYNVFDPDTKQLGKGVVADLKKKFPPGFLPYPGCPKFATATIGTPITEVHYAMYLAEKGGEDYTLFLEKRNIVNRPLTLTELGVFMKLHPLTLIEFVMVENIGRMLPPEAQGVYRDYIRDVKPGAWTQI